LGTSELPGEIDVKITVNAAGSHLRKPFVAERLHRYGVSPGRNKVHQSPETPSPSRGVQMMSTSTQALGSRITSQPSATQSRFTLRNTAELAGRILLMTLFLLSGLGKLGAYAATAGYMTSVGVPGALLPLVIATEVLGSIAILLGWQTRLVSLLLAGFTLLSAVLFHNNLADQMQMIMFFKNVSITGAFLMLAANGAGALSLDARKSK